MIEALKNQQYFMLKTVLDQKINPEYAFDIFLNWIVTRVDGYTLEKMAGKMLRASWEKQRNETNRN